MKMVRAREAARRVGRGLRQIFGSSREGRSAKRIAIALLGGVCRLPACNAFFHAVSLGLIALGRLGHVIFDALHPPPPAQRGSAD
jgi:hypothetical protein